MSPLPIHFFTIVLNGEPYVRHHIKEFAGLARPWHWHIIEGAAEICACGNWQLGYGGKLDPDVRAYPHSTDGTLAYLHELQQKYPYNVTVYRQESAWMGKISMVNRPIPNIPDCLLMQVDVDECWTAEQIERAARLMESQPDKWAAEFWFECFYGPAIVCLDRGCRNRRLFRFQKGMRWVRHEPPVLTRLAQAHEVISAEETAAEGLIYQHYNLADEATAAFKEVYYGRPGFADRWRALQQYAADGGAFPVPMGQFFPPHWPMTVGVIERCADHGITPLVDVAPWTADAQKAVA